MSKILTIDKLANVIRWLEEARFDKTKWKKLGETLGLHPNTLNMISANKRGDTEDYFRHCLVKWLNRADGVDDVGKPSFNTLADALEKMNECKDQAEYIRDLAQEGDTGKMGEKNAKSTGPKIDSTKKSSKDGGAKASGGDDVIDGPTPSQGKIEKWLEEGEVVVEITRINMHGAPGAGKTCTQHLLLNEPPPAPPDELTDSTPIACPAVKATRISIDDENKKWERVKEKDLLNQLASRLNEAPNETEHKRILREAPMPTNPVPVPLDDSSLKVELSEKKPPENKPLEKKPTDMEVIKDIVSALEARKFEKFSTNWVYFIDSGGQPAYRELLPLFTRAAALNIITIDLTKDLDEKCQFQYRFDQFQYPININQRYSNHDIIQSTVSSGAMFNPIEIPYVSKSHKHKDIHPRYFILGTHKDKLEKNSMLDKLIEMNKILLEEYKANAKVITIPQDQKIQDSIIFPVNTLLPEGSERKKASVALCTKISSFGVAVTIRIPIRLFAFEIFLQREAKNKERSFLTREEVKEIGKSLRLDNESDINEALRYLHNVTIILYYPDVLLNIIFVDPKPILDVLSRLLASTYINRTETDNLRKLGLFNEDLLQLFGEEIFKHVDFKSSHMITLLMHLHIIAKVENRIEGDYFFPCALPSHGDLLDPPTEIQPLLIAWEIDERDETTLAIPQGLFPLTIVHLLEKKDDIRFSPKSNLYYRYNNAMSLHVSRKYHIDIINRYTHLEIRVRGHCRNICPQIRELVSKAVEDSSKDLKLKEDNKFVFAFKCPPRNTCIVQEDKCSTLCTLCEDQCDVLQSDDDSYRCWFSDHQSSSPGAAETGMIRKRTHSMKGAEPSLEGPPTKRHKGQLDGGAQARAGDEDIDGSASQRLIEKYTKMTDEFDFSLLNAVKEALAIKSIDDVKKCLLDLIEVEDWASEVDAVTDETSLAQLLQRYCFLSNLSLLKYIAVKLDLKESKSRIDQLAEERDAFYSKVLAEDFAAAAIEDHEIIKEHHVEMTVVVSWSSFEATLAKIQKCIAKEFKDGYLSMFIALRTVHHSDLTFMFTAPIWLKPTIGLALATIAIGSGILYITLNDEKYEVVPAPVPRPELFPELDEMEYETKLSEDDVKDIVKDFLILLMTATDVELRGVLGYLKPLDGRDKVIEKFINTVYIYIGKYGEYSVVVGKSADSKGQQGGSNALLITNKIMEIFEPRYIIGVGICFGMDRSKVNLGDVIVSDMIADLTIFKIVNGIIEIRGSQPPAGTTLSRFFGNTSKFKMKHSDKENSKKVKVYCSPIVSTSALVNDKDFKEDLRKVRSDALAGEMEGAGIFLAASNAHHKVEAIVIKAVGDWGDGKKDECRGWKPFASHAAARYVHYKLDNAAPDDLQ